MFTLRRLPQWENMLLMACALSNCASLRSASSRLSSLSRLFSENLRTKLIDYITQERVARSMDDLVDTGAPVFEIAEKCGFSSSRNYIAAFRKLYGTTPGEDRKANRRIQ